MRRMPVDERISENRGAILSDAIKRLDGNRLKFGDWVYIGSGGIDYFIEKNVGDGYLISNRHRWGEEQAGHIFKIKYEDIFYDQTVRAWQITKMSHLEDVEHFRKKWSDD